MELSDYEIERLGVAAPFIRNAVIAAVHEAQDAAVRAHSEQGWSDRDAYSNVLRVNLNRCLLRELKDVPGINAGKPEGQRPRFDLPVVQETGVVLYWWRVPGDGKTPVAQAKLRRTSFLQSYLLGLAPAAADNQMTLDHAALTDEELEQQRIDDEQFRAEMRSVEGRTMVLWVSASPDGLFDFGWGDAELVDEATGELAWTRGPYSLNNAAPVAPPLRVAGHDEKKVDRFDSDTEHDTGFGLSVRDPLEEVSSEADQNEGEQTTGSEDS